MENGMQELKKSSLFIKKEYGQCGLTAIFAAGLFSILYVIKGMYPFGSGSIMMTDMYSQYVPLLYRFYDVVSGQKNLFVDFRLSGGANMYVDTINEVLNPLYFCVVCCDLSIFVSNFIDLIFLPLFLDESG